MRGVKTGGLVLLMLLLLSGIGNAQLALSLSQRLDYRIAQFVWETMGDDSTLAGYVVQCGSKPGQYFLQSDVQPIDATSLLVSSIVKTNGTFYCIVGATDMRSLLAASNEVKIEVKGRNLTVFQ